MKDIALNLSGAKIRAMTGQNTFYPANNILESNGSFWVSCGLYPQILEISFQALSSIAEIGVHSLNVKRLKLSTSTEEEGRNFKEVKSVELAKGEGRRQDETIYSDPKNTLKAKHLRVSIESGYQPFVGIYHIKVIGDSGSDSASSTYSAQQMKIQMGGFNSGGEGESGDETSAEDEDLSFRSKVQSKGSDNLGGFRIPERGGTTGQSARGKLQSSDRAVFRGSEGRGIQDTEDRQINSNPDQFRGSFLDDRDSVMNVETGERDSAMNIETGERDSVMNVETEDDGEEGEDGSYQNNFKYSSPKSFLPSYT